MEIRKANVHDGEEVLPLVLIVLRDMELPIFEKFTDEELVEFLLNGFKTTDYRYSYKRCWLAEESGEIAGVAFGYPESNEAHIDNAIKPFLEAVGLDSEDKIFEEKEAVPGEWYLDTIVTNPKFRGRGVASYLIEAMAKDAKAAGETIMGLNCDFDNVGANRVYTRAGFEVTGEIMLGEHHYHHMQKKL